MSAPAPEFADTNIWLYVYDGAGPRQPMAVELLERLAAGGNGRISIQVVQEFAVNALRASKTAISPAEVVDAVEAMGDWILHRPAAPDVAEAVVISARHQLSFWDAMIVLSARQLGCAVLWTEDLNSGQMIEGVTVKNPFA
ncbi:MAG: PIN domain-containing protein [Bifidobacteriaceae bacterium]|jgi:predicted nucleic acid-binding protein|nr:PIN domain-containing protein [Bifidobacteriaceae bacterium]